MANSILGNFTNFNWVVNCFQISNFVLWQTAVINIYTKVAEL